MIDELKKVVRDYESSRPRTLQRKIGPSEAGTKCSRRLAYRLLGVEPSNTSTDPWAAIVGTSVHTWLEKAFAADNERSTAKGEKERWQCEARVELYGYMGGTADLYDRATATVIDHKVLGAASLKSFRKDGPSEQYKTQVHLYACGLRLAGAKVENVAIMAWSRSGALKDAIWWQEPYNEQIVEDTLARLDAVRNTVEALGLGALPLIPTADAFCMWCPFYMPGATEASEACAGHA